jgi:hypothetical protein
MGAKDFLKEQRRLLEIPKWQPEVEGEGIAGKFLYVTAYDFNNCREWHLIREDDDSNEEWIIISKKESVLDGKMEGAHLEPNRIFCVVFLGEKPSARDHNRRWKDYKVAMEPLEGETEGGNGAGGGGDDESQTIPF